MSTTVLDRPAPRVLAGRAGEALLGLGPFAAFGLYGALRWGTMLGPDPVLRLLGMLGLALLISAISLTPLARRPWLAVPVAIVALLIVIPLSGLPVSWIWEERIELTVDTIRQGLSGLPAVLVPYSGVNTAVRSVIQMGAGVLLIDGALMLAFAPRTLGELRMAVAALPLVVLAVVPAALARPHAPYLQGVALFLLLAAVVWGERIVKHGRLGAIVIVILAAGGALLAAPTLDTRHAWIDFRNLANAFEGKGEKFDWAQGYGRLHWPRKGHQVLQIQARFPSYWKTENLETFNGTGWTNEAAAFGAVGVPDSALKKWTETLHVTDTGIDSEEVVAAGTAGAPPEHLPTQVLSGQTTGTWTTAQPLRPGDSYLISAYVPQPTASQLRAASSAYPTALQSGYLSMTEPAFSTGDVRLPLPVTVYFAPFHRHTQLVMGGNESGQAAGRVIGASPYGRAYRLAQSLARQSATPYAFAEAIKTYLSHGYRYNESPPASRYPILGFLFGSHRGYCQQFAGAMALLLRMGGVPARVATGFTTGVYEPSTHSYSVSDIDAHAWVEAWFPGYGWIKFDPTPGADPALGGVLPSTPVGTASTLNFHDLPRHEVTPTPATNPTVPVVHLAGGSGDGTVVLIIVAAAAIVIVLLLTRTALMLRAERVDPIEELSRAYARCQRPLAPGTTLAGLEHRLRYRPQAAEYVRELRLRRYAGAGTATDGVPSSGRGAMRREFTEPRGPLGWLRGLYALPPAPRRLRHRPRSRRTPGLE